MERSGEDMSYTDPESGDKFVPHVVEPTFGADRTVLAVLCSAYTEEEVATAKGKMEKRVVLKLPAEIAPLKAAVLPLSNKEELKGLAKEVWDDLRSELAVEYDSTQSIGRRYRRQDEIGTPFCVTVDFDSLEDGAVTVRDGDTMKQERVFIKEVRDYVKDGLKGQTRANG
jgi:glycyl-tRNA synthetase